MMTGKYTHRMTSFYGEVFSVVRNLGGTDEEVRLTKEEVILISIHC